MRASSVTRDRGRRGAAMMEATLLLPLFLVFWFGIVDWGITFYVHQSLVYNANAAARWGVVNPYDPVKITNMVLYGSPEAPPGATSGRFGLTPANVSVSIDPPGSTDPDNRRLVIRVSNYTWTHFTPWFAGGYTGRDIVVSLPTEDFE